MSICDPSTCKVVAKRKSVSGVGLGLWMKVDESIDESQCIARGAPDSIPLDCLIVIAMVCCPHQTKKDPKRA